MDESELLQKTANLKEKLNRALRRVAGLREKSKILEMQYSDAREREKNTNDLVMELLERQRELNVMLNRTNIMLNRTQEAMALTSMEFNEMAKALPEPKKAEWTDRISKVNDLFKKTGIQDAEVVGLDTHTGETLSSDELENQSREAFGRKESFWQRREVREPPHVQAAVVEDGGIGSEENQQLEPDEPTISLDEDTLVLTPQRRSWWRKVSGDGG